MNEAQIEIFNESSIDLPTVNQIELFRVVKEIYSDHNIECEWLNIVLLNDEEHTKMNNDYLNHDYSTDIITFEFEEGEKINGEIYINHQQMLKNAEEYSTSAENELSRLIIHGALHLNGYDDHSEDEKTEMTKKEDYYLGRIEA